VKWNIIRICQTDKSGENSGNSRNGKSNKQVILDNGKIDISVPRDRNSEFSPKLIEKRQSRLSGIDDVILSLYGKGMIVRDIQQCYGMSHLLYGF
jgi:putative transposase